MPCASKRTGPLDTVQAAAGPVRVSVEANEDHVPSRGWEGARWQARLGYVHEGVYEAGGERKLRNLFYFGVLCRGNTEALCTAVWRHLEAHYELEAIKRGDRQTVRKLLKEAYERADRGSRRRAIEDALTYFLRQWGGVEAWSR